MAFHLSSLSHPSLWFCAFATSLRVQLSLHKRRNLNVIDIFVVVVVVVFVVQLSHVRTVLFTDTTTCGFVLFCTSVIELTLSPNLLSARLYSHDKIYNYNFRICFRHMVLSYGDSGSISPTYVYR